MKNKVYILDNTSETDYSNIDADNIVLLVDNSISISDDTQVSLDGKVDKVTGSSLIADTSITRLANTSGTNTGDQDLSGKLDKNTTITPSTKTKITYDADGLVTEGKDATTDDINDSTDRRYLTDTQKTEATRNATTSQNGLISPTDWNTFNDKQDSGNYEPAFTKNTAFNKNFGTTSGTIPQGNEVLRTSDALTTVTENNKLITVEDYGGLIYISQWNPTTNTPTLADADATKFREAYISLNDFTRFGIDWEKGDYLVYDINGDIFKEKNPLLNIVSTVGFSNNYDDLDNFPTFKTVENLNILGTGNIDLTKTMVGLGNVDNTSDLNKPVSTDTQTALNLKANKASPTFTGDVTSGGNIEAPTIKLTSGAADGYFLKTDADGNATWTPISASQVYKGTWNADTNTPTLADSTGVQGNFYRVTTPGTSDLGSGNKTFEINDDVSHNGTIWERIPAVGYTLQTATSTVLGGVKIGNGVSISNSVISVSTDYEPTKGLDDNYVTDAEAVVIGNTSGTNTGDEDTSSIQTKRPLKTIEGLPLEGNGDIDLTKAMVALGSADNTSDADKPISSATQTALNNKVDKVTGSSLIQDTSITRLADTSGTNTGDQDLSPYSTATGVEDNADVTDTTNVTAAGALMGSELTSIVDVKAIDQSLISGAAPVFDASNMTNLPEGSVDVLSNVGTARIIGRNTAGVGDSEELTVVQVRSLINVENGATADQTGSQIKAAYEVQTNAYTDAKNAKLSGIEESADVTDTSNVAKAGALMNSEITNLAQVKAFNSANYATALQGNKADSASQASGVEDNADVTNTANVTIAGALMDSEVTNLAQVKTFDSSDYATKEQGELADSSVQNVGDETINGNKTFLNKALLPNQSGTKGAGIGSNSSSFYSFYQSNGTTRKGYIGFPITTNSDLSIGNDASNKSLTLRENGNLDYNGDVIAQNFIGNGSQITNVDASSLNGLSIVDANANIPWPFIPDVGADGLMEIGRYIDFHLASNSGVDNNGRLALTSDKNLDWGGDFTADNFFEGSDKRLKTNIKKISKSVYSYELKTQPGITVYGTIAQEIEKTNPEVVKKLEDGGMMSVNYNSFLSLKLAEQENKTDDLQKQIDELKELIKNK